MKRSSRGVLALAMVLELAVGLPRTFAGVIYWDPWSPGSFGTIDNVTHWMSPLNIVWTTSNTGGSTRLKDYSTTLSDDCNFGGPVAALGGGTIPVDTVNAKTISFNTISGSGTVLLSGGTITLAATTSITVNNIADTISSTLAGAATGLTKAGAGTLFLSGTNIYSGATTVSAGTLSISVAYLADGADVTVATNATLNLDFTGSDTIRSLVLDGQPTVAGVWGGLASPASFKSERLTGIGTLTVSTGVAPPGMLITIR